MTEAWLYDWEHHSLSMRCREEVSASHRPHDTPLFMKGALYLKLRALSSWSLMRAVTALHKHHPGSLWTLGFDRLWWAITWLIRLIYFKVSFRKRSSPPAGMITTKSLLHCRIHVPKYWKHKIYTTCLVALCQPTFPKFFMYWGCSIWWKSQVSS